MLSQWYNFLVNVCYFSGQFFTLIKELKNLLFFNRNKKKNLLSHIFHWSVRSSHQNDGNSWFYYHIYFAFYALFMHISLKWIINISYCVMQMRIFLSHFMPSQFQSNIKIETLKDINDWLLYACGSFYCF